MRDAKVKDAVAFGDNYNDVEMLNTVGYGFLMANAPEDLKKNAANIAADHNHDGIYYALRDLHLI
ncbi:HAD family hydrolase [Diplocloster hominis]|uniref:HAD family hydrolase n=1 Tax=Diplocloster hominis TaxID=3079010 RepID=UPI0031BBBAC6